MPHAASLEPHAVWFRPYVVKPTKVGDVNRNLDTLSSNKEVLCDEVGIGLGPLHL